MSQVQQSVESTIFQRKRKNIVKINNCNANWRNIISGLDLCIHVDRQQREPQKMQYPSFFSGSQVHTVLTLTVAIDL